MATKQITDFSAVTTPAGADLLLTQQAADAVTRKLTYTQLDLFIRVPDADGTKDLGSSSYRFRDLYLSRRATFSDAAAAPGSAGQFQRNGAALEFHDGTAARKLYQQSGTDVAVADGGTGASTASDARTNLGLVIGTDVAAQSHAAASAAVHGLPASVNVMGHRDGAGYFAQGGTFSPGNSGVTDRTVYEAGPTVVTFTTAYNATPFVAACIQADLGTITWGGVRTVSTTGASLYILQAASGSASGTPRYLAVGA